MQVVMASGFAGGIGLCSGVCRALGAVIWLIALDSEKEGTSKPEYSSNPRYIEKIDRFVESTGGEFEC